MLVRKNQLFCRLTVCHSRQHTRMFAVLTMMPDMPMGQWLLVTLTAGVGGSLLSIGYAADIALWGRPGANTPSVAI